MTAPDTIAAIATPLGTGGIGIIRISGPKAETMARRLFLPKSGRDCPFESHRLYYGSILSPESGAIIDEGLVTLMRAPRSFTGEDTLEVHCHGGLLVVQKILSAAIEAGARLAEPGEFTRRAFLNNRLNLAQAEAVAEIIAARTEEGLKLALSHLRGNLTGKIETLRSGLIDLLGLLEATIEFGEEDIDAVADVELTGKMEVLSGQIKDLLITYEQGRLYTSGLNVVITGRPNVGKSSLMNTLAGKKKAIVTPIPGTTRDILEDSIHIRGIPIRLVDTAGIRKAKNVIEEEGISLVRGELERADVVLVVLDGNIDLTEQDMEIIEKNRQKPLLVLINKSDLPQKIYPEELKRLLGELTCLNISAKFGKGIEELKDRIYKLVAATAGDPDSVLVTNLRHKLALERAYDLLRQAHSTIAAGLSPELASLDIQEAADSLGEITGKVVTDDILDNIFSRFCLGK